MLTLRRLLPLLAALLALGVPANAQADPRVKALIKDCAEDGELDRQYPDSLLKRAKDELGADLAEYSYCIVSIDAQLLDNGRDRKNGGPGGGTGASGGSPAQPDFNSTGALPQPTPEDLAALDVSQVRGQRGASPAVEVDGRRLTPGTSDVKRTAAAANAMPVPLLLLLIAVGLLFAAATLPAARRPLAGISRVARRITRR